MKETLVNIYDAAEYKLQHANINMVPTRRGHLHKSEFAVVCCTLNSVIVIYTRFDKARIFWFFFVSSLVLLLSSNQ